MRDLFKIATLIVALALSIMATTAQNTQLISYDEVISGELSNEAYEQFYTFEGQEGDTIVIRMSATSEEPRLDSYLYLRDENGEELAFDDDMGGNLNSLIGPYTLPYSGTYTVVATRFQQANGSSEGTYEVVVSLADFESLEVNQNVDIIMTEPEQVEFFSFTANETGIYELNMSLLNGNVGADVSVRDQSGNFYAGTGVDSHNTSNFAVLPLEAGEMVTLFVRYYSNYGPNGVVDDQSEAEIRIRMETVEAVDLEVVENQPVQITGELADADSVNYYHFEAFTGQELEITGGAPNGGDFELFITTPQGYNAFYGSTFYMEGEVLVPNQVLMADGDYILVINQGNLPPEAQTDGTVAYDITLNVSAIEELVSGVAVEGTIDNSNGYYEDTFVYAGTEGESITFNLTSLDENYAPSFSIELFPQEQTQEYYTGFNANFHSSATNGTINYQVTLPQDGDYIIRIHNSAYSPEQQAGTYTLTLETDR